MIILYILIYRGEDKDSTCLRVRFHIFPAYRWASDSNNEFIFSIDCCMQFLSSPSGIQKKIAIPDEWREKELEFFYNSAGQWMQTYIYLQLLGGL